MCLTCDRLRFVLKNKWCHSENNYISSMSTIFSYLSSQSLTGLEIFTIVFFKLCFLIEDFGLGEFEIFFSHFIWIVTELKRIRIKILNPFQENLYYLRTNLLWSYLIFKDLAALLWWAKHTGSDLQNLQLWSWASFLIFYKLLFLMKKEETAKHNATGLNLCCCYFCFVHIPIQNSHWW